MQKDEVEEAEINAYMEAEAEKPKDDIRKVYLKGRYEGIKSEYRTLRLAKDEAAERKDEKRLNELTQHFRDNFKARKWAVTSLRAMGEAVEDPFIALSAV